MQCAAFECRLQWLLDRRLRPEEDDDLLEHASDCEVCARLLDAQTYLFRTLAIDHRPELDDDFACRIMDSLAVETSPQQRPARIPFGIIAAVAAALLLATLPFWPSGDDQAPGPPVVRTPPANEVPVSEREFASLDHPEAAEFGPLLQQWVRQLSASPIEEFETVDQLSGGIRSLASTINVAIDALRRNMPVNHEAMLEKPQADLTRPAWLPQLS
ncbi:MAG: hypothetical protein ACC628_26925 [Pirellulaceae bacterium]